MNDGLDREDFVERLYEAAILPEMWPSVLEEFSELIEGKFASLVAFDGGVSRWTGTGEAVALIDEFQSFEHRMSNSRIERAIKTPWPGFLTDLDLFSAAEMDDDPFYVEFMRPRGYGWTAGTMFNLPSGGVLAFAVERSFARGPVERPFVAELDALRPHLGRSALMSARLHRERAKATTQALEALGLPAAALARDGKLLLANPLFCELMPDVFRDERQRLRIQDGHADQALKAYLAGPATAARSLAAPGGPTRTPLVIHLVPVCGAARDIFASAASIVLATPVTKRPGIEASLLESLFDLTPAEAVLAGEIAQANSLSALAEKYRLSPETLRGRLKAVFFKTGTHRQSELAHLLGGALVLPKSGQTIWTAETSKFPS